MSKSRDFPIDDREEVYNGVIQTVIKNTGNNQPMGIRRATLLANRKHARHDLDQVRKAINGAVQSNNLIEYLDENDKRRYAIPTEETVRKIIELEASKDDPCKPLIGKLNKLLDEID